MNAVEWPYPSAQRYKQLCRHRPMALRCRQRQKRTCFQSRAGHAALHTDFTVITAFVLSRTYKELLWSFEQQQGQSGNGGGSHVHRCQKLRGGGRTVRFSASSAARFRSNASDRSCLTLSAIIVFTTSPPLAAARDVAVSRQSIAPFGLLWRVHPTSAPRDVGACSFSSTIYA